MVKSHRLPEPHLAAFRPVDSRRGLPVVERLLMLPLPAPAVLRGVFCRRAGALAAGLAYRSSPGFACSAAAARRARHSLAADDLVEITLPPPARWCPDRPERVFLDPIFRRVLSTRFPRTNRSCSQENRSAEFRYHPFAAGAFHDRGASAAGFGPLTDFVVVGGACGLASTVHESPSSVDFFWVDSFVAVPAEL